ncbi:MAG TPA: DUF2783 domain-containing protein [Paracoccaceae bacterium]|nr:DUF2783 domain-containing protein [Paracoccaceae bacterium]
MTPAPDNLGPARDEIYAALIAAHQGLSEGESHALNARLVLMLANAVGDRDLLLAIFAQARDQCRSSGR